MRLIIILILIAALVAAAYVMLKRPQKSAGERLSPIEILSGDGAEGFKRALEVRDFEFPADLGPHSEYQTEWWYYTGNLTDSSGRRFGYQLTFFRRGLSPGEPERESRWASNQVYFAHFALSDIDGSEFHAFERWSRGSLGLAGARVEPYRVWVGEWSAGQEGESVILRAGDGPVAVALELTPLKPAVFHGAGGLSQKSGEPGNASYYFSETRLHTTGTVSVDAREFEVGGLSWLDREWSTSALGKDQEGWDWFSLQLDDGREIMLYRLRLKGGGVDSHSSGTVVEKDGTARNLKAGDFKIDVLDSWESPDTGTVYPSRWRVTIPKFDIELTVTPYQSAQELLLSFVYWEGAVGVSGDGLSGSGYVELTGYRAHD